MVIQLISLTMVLVLVLVGGLVIAVNPERVEVKTLTTCVDGSVSLTGENPCRIQRETLRQSWMFKGSNGSLFEIGNCPAVNGSCNTSTPVLPDGTRVSFESHESHENQLHLERKAGQSYAQEQVQILLEYSLHCRQLFKVNFTVHCVWTRQGTNLNLSEIALGIYPGEKVLDGVYFLANGTKFALIDRSRGATLLMANETSRPVPAFWHRLVIVQGSLIITEINTADNGTTITTQARLKRKIRLFGVLSAKTVRVFVLGSAEPSGRPLSTTPFYPKESDHPPRYKFGWGLIVLILIPVTVFVIAEIWYNAE